MRDFTRPALSIDAQRGQLIRKLVLLQVVGAPIFIATVLAAMACFGDTALIPALADPQIAQTALILFGAAFLVECFLTLKTVRALAALRSPET